MPQKYLPSIGALVGAVGLVLYLLLIRGNGTDNLTGLLIELAGVFVEVVLIVLVVDQLAESRERKRWATLHAALGTTLQRSVVDLMRVNYLFVSPDSADQVRRLEFLDLARFALGDLRSQVESFTASLDTDSQSVLRSIEEKLNYLFRSFHSISLQLNEGTPASVAYETHIFFRSQQNWSTLVAVAEETGIFLRRIGVRADEVLEKVVESAVAGRVKDLKLDSSFPANFYRERYGAQDVVIQQEGLGYVLLDSTGATNLAYYLIDHLMLSEVAPLFSEP